MLMLRFRMVCENMRCRSSVSRVLGRRYLLTILKRYEQPVDIWGIGGVLVVSVPRHRRDLGFVAYHELHSLSELDGAFTGHLFLRLQKPHVAHDGP
jgi:hypothetical protein